MRANVYVFVCVCVCVCVSVSVSACKIEYKITAYTRKRL